MAKSSTDWGSIRLSPTSLTLMLGWRPQAKRLSAETIDINSDVAVALREICTETLKKFSDLTLREYEDTATLDEGEEYFSIRLDQLPKTAPSASPNAGIDDDEAEEVTQIADLIRILQDPGAARRMTPGQAGNGSFLFYAIVCKDADGHQVSFIKQHRGFRVARTGRLLTLFSDRLTRIESPVFSFASDVDLVIRKDELVVLRSEAYVQLFTDIDILRSAVPAYVERLSSSISVTLDETALQVVEKVCQERASLAKRLRRLNRKSWLASITESSLRAQIDSMPELPDGVRLSGSIVSVDERSVPILLNLLEDVYYRGHHDSSLRSAQAYRFGVS
ncbi:Kiwa anti-phage protein KwaB-like domain-containing protein [Pseudonocardia sp. KRD291]|uniref:Kiwa anti-phage protein KwaB-like domain-containing protein n=1 Tax=Pseudonocardia sp. KRD291 TaxID=2792007 RepID=UPI001C4A6680|nr:Kiwa anti-phage protein KwaB-like domain-containing protein [Pseudonocardia sp. KRD291]MBW0101468.1 DUF4868 domain-containing protein [Pseudonocardia sp. KRD291]